MLQIFKHEWLLPSDTVLSGHSKERGNKFMSKFDHHKLQFYKIQQDVSRDVNYFIWLFPDEIAYVVSTLSLVSSFLFCFKELKINATAHHVSMSTSIQGYSYLGSKEQIKRSKRCNCIRYAGDYFCKVLFVVKSPA